MPRNLTTGRVQSNMRTRMPDNFFRPLTINRISTGKNDTSVFILFQNVLGYVFILFQNVLGYVW